jgi:hypothetical protein
LKLETTVQKISQWESTDTSLDNVHVRRKITSVVKNVQTVVVFVY